MSDAALTVKQEIDDLLDKVEVAIDKVRLVPVRATAKAAVALVRDVLSIPDNIGGDPD